MLNYNMTYSLRDIDVTSKGWPGLVAYEFNSYVYFSGIATMLRLNVAGYIDWFKESIYALNKLSHLPIIWSKSDNLLKILCHPKIAMVIYNILTGIRNSIYDRYFSKELFELAIPIAQGLYGIGWDITNGNYFLEGWYPEHCKNITGKWNIRGVNTDGSICVLETDSELPVIEQVVLPLYMHESYIGEAIDCDVVVEKLSKGKKWVRVRLK